MMWNNSFWQNGFVGMRGWPQFSFLSFFPLIIILAVVDIILKGYALWLSARKGQQAWFIILLIFNTLGILPLVYILLNRETKRKKK